MKINEASLSNTNYINQSQKNSEKVLGMIASGHQNRLDDVASANIATLLQSQVSSMGQGLMNLNDGVSMMQIAGGATSRLGEDASRLAELNVRYNSASLNSSDRAALSEEFSALTQSMQDTISGATYNGKSLFGSDLSFETSQGVLNASVGAVDLSALDITSGESIQAFMDQLASVQSNIGSSTNAMGSTIASLQQNLLSTSSALSQLQDTDMAEAVNQLKNEDMKVQVATLAQAHKTTLLQDQMSRLLGS